MGVRKRGEQFVLDYYVDGQRVREAVGENRRQAEQFLIQRKAEILLGRHPTPQENRITFAQVAEQYLAWSKQHKRSWNDDRVMLNRLLPQLGGLTLAQITPWQLEKVKQQLCEDGCSGARVNRYLTTLSSLFHRAEDWGLLTHGNPLRRVKKFRESPGRLRYLSPDEMARLLAVCEDEDLRVAVTVALGTGMRRGEIFGLRWRDVDLDNSIIHVIESKNDSRREIPMGQEVRAVLAAKFSTKQTGELVFAHPDGKRYGTRMRKAWDRACSKAGLTGFRFHDLRHTFASHLVMNGASLSAVQDLLGHKSPIMTRRYSHLAPGVLRQAIATMDALLPSAKNSAQGNHLRHNVGTNADRPDLKIVENVSEFRAMSR